MDEATRIFSFLEMNLLQNIFFFQLLARPVLIFGHSFCSDHPWNYKYILHLLSFLHRWTSINEIWFFSLQYVNSFNLKFPPEPTDLNENIFFFSPWNLTQNEIFRSVSIEIIEKSTCCIMQMPQGLMAECYKNI